MSEKENRTGEEKVNSEWYYSKEGERFGSLTLTELKKLVENNELSPTDLVWEKELGEWLKAGEVEELFPKRTATEPPPLPTTVSKEQPSSALQNEISPEMFASAEHNKLQATFKLDECQAHYTVYGTTKPQVARDGLEFINFALKINPNASGYWNIKALLLIDGLGNCEEGLKYLRKALELEPDSIVIKQSIRSAEQRQNKSGMGCALIPLFFVFCGIILYSII
jgi:tetratricopeptide (TPR) repeat protein